MIPLVADKLDEVAALCRTYGIRRLELFGSAAKGTFDPEASDLDFIADLGEYERGVAKRSFAFCEAMEGLFGRPVDVITVRQISNPYFRAELDASREPLHDAPFAAAAS